MQLAQLRAGLDGELGDQDVAQLPVGAQRVGLPPGPVQREHPLVPEPLAERMGRWSASRAPRSGPGAPAGRPRYGPRLQCSKALLFQPAASVPPGGQRSGRPARLRASGQGLVETTHPRDRVPGRQRHIALAGRRCPNRSASVPPTSSPTSNPKAGGPPANFPRRRASCVARTDGPAGCRLPARRAAGPQLLDQPVGRNDLVGVHQQDGKYGPGARARQSQRLAVGRHLERTEHCELHPGLIPPAAGAPRTVPGAGKSTVSPP